jgi:hypothetical protein
MTMLNYNFFKLGELIWVYLVDQTTLLCAIVSKATKNVLSFDLSPYDATRLSFYVFLGFC